MLLYKRTLNAINSLASIKGQRMQIVYIKSLCMDHGYFTFSS